MVKVTKSWGLDTCSTILMSYFCLMTEGQLDVSRQTFEFQWIRGYALTYQDACVHASKVRSHMVIRRLFHKSAQAEYGTCSLSLTLKQGNPRATWSFSFQLCQSSSSLTQKTHLLLKKHILVSIVTSKTSVGVFFFQRELKVTDKTAASVGMVGWSFKTGLYQTGLD